MKQRPILVEIYPDAIMAGLVLAMKMMLIIASGMMAILIIFSLRLVFPDLNILNFSFWQGIVLSGGILLIQIVCLEHFVFKPMKEFK